MKFQRYCGIFYHGDTYFVSLIIILTFIGVVVSIINPRYDDSVLKYAPDGSIQQLEYIGRAIKDGNLCIGLKCHNGLILATKRKSFTKRLASGAGCADFGRVVSCTDGLL